MKMHFIFSACLRPTRNLAVMSTMTNQQPKQRPHATCARGWRVVRAALLLALVSAGQWSCQEVTCAPGTIERQGACEPADQNVSAATCGPGTVLEGAVCVPQLPPTVCDEASTAPDFDPSTGVTTCIGTGGGSCGAPLPCPPPEAGKMTICGRILELENDSPVVDPAAQQQACAGGAGTPTGPCSLGIRPFDAVAFASNPQGATPLAVAETLMDACGRFRLTNITITNVTYVGLGLDDRTQPGPAGNTVTTGVAVQAAAGSVVRGLDVFTVKPATIAMWTQTAGLAQSILAGGVYVSLFRAGKTGLAGAADVVVTRGSMPAPADDYYFAANESTRVAIDRTASKTGKNGAALLVGSALGPHGGAGGLPATCAWEPKVGAAVPGVVLVQSRRPVNAPGQTCPL